MKFKHYILSSLAFLQLLNAQESTEVKIHNDLNTALQQVDTDGEYLKLEKSGELLETITKKLDEYILPEIAKSGELPAAFSFAKILDVTGISEVTAGSGSIKKDGNRYISKHFIQTNGSRKGLLSLMGKSDKPWASLEYAPANTALLIETHLDLTAAPEIMKQVAPMMGQREAKKMLKSLDEKGPLGKNTLEQILLQANARISIIAELDETKTWQLDGQQFAAIKAAGRIDGIAKFLWQQYGEAVSQNLPVQSEGNVHTIISPQPIPAPWGQLTPVIVIDTDNNHIWISLSKEYLQTCRSGKSKLTDNKDFQLSNKHNRDSGTVRLYISKLAMTTATDLLQDALKNEFKNGPTEEKIINEFINYFDLKNNISACVSHDELGILLNTNAPFPLKDSQLSRVQIIASLAGLSYGPILKHLESAQRTEDIMKIKNVYSALLGFMAQNDGEFPDNLQQLVDEGNMADDKYIKFKGRKLHYIKGLTPADSDKIILYTSPDKSGMAIRARVDGSVKAIHHFELEELLAAQK